MGVFEALVAQAWLLAAPAPDGAAQGMPASEPRAESGSMPAAEPTPEVTAEPSAPSDRPAATPPVLPPAPSTAAPAQPVRAPLAEDAAADRDELVDPWSVGPPVGAAAPPDRASLRDPFSHRASGPRRSPPPGTVVVAQLDLQDPFARQPPTVSTRAEAPTRATLDLHDPFADGAAVRWNPCKAQETVGGVVVQRPRAVQEHAEAQCSRREAGPLRDPFARPRASTASPPPAPPVSPRARSV